MAFIFKAKSIKLFFQLTFFSSVFIPLLSYEAAAASDNRDDKVTACQPSLKEAERNALEIFAGIRKEYNEPQKLDTEELKLYHQI